MLDNRDEPVRRVGGTVKWFDPVKGFGFVIAHDGGPDILLHANVLRNFGQGSIADGAEVEIDVQTTARGVQAVEVITIEPPVTPGQAGLTDLQEFDEDELLSAPLEPARVKWFDKAKGFGFANAFGSDADVFLHIEVVRRSGLADLQSGEAVALRVIDGKRGRMATQICPWEAALDRDAADKGDA